MNATNYSLYFTMKAKHKSIKQNIKVMSIVCMYHKAESIVIAYWPGITLLLLYTVIILIHNNISPPLAALPFPSAVHYFVVSSFLIVRG